MNITNDTINTAYKPVFFLNGEVIKNITNDTINTVSKPVIFRNGEVIMNFDKFVEHKEAKYEYMGIVTSCRSTYTYVYFGKEYYDYTPNVMISIKMIDIGTDCCALRLSVEAENISSNGFRAAFYSWDDSRVFKCSASWMAYGM